MSNTCDCSRPCGDQAFACTECTKTARANLGHIADLAASLDEKRAKVRSNWDVSNVGAARPAKQWRTSSGERFTFAASPTFTPSAALGFDPRVSRVANRVQNGLVGIVRELPERLQHGTLAADSGPHQIARWLSCHVDEIRKLETAGEIFDLIGRMVGDLQHLFDNPPPKLFLGECKAEFEDGECTESLYLDADKITAEQVACPRCGITHDVAERRNTLMEGVNDYLGTAKEISRLLRNLAGADVSERRIREYAGHGLLTRMGARREYGRDGSARDVATYRIGDVRNIVETVQRRRQERREMKRENGRIGA